MFSIKLRLTMIVGGVFLLLQPFLAAVATSYTIEYGPSRPYAAQDVELIAEPTLVPEFKTRHRSTFHQSVNGGLLDSRMLWVDINYPASRLNEKNQDIEEIRISGNNLSNFDFMTGLPRLTDVCIDGNSDQMPQSLIAALASDRALRTITLIGDLSHLDLSPLSALPNLSELKLHKTKINVAMIKQLASIQSLEALEISEPKILSEDVPKLTKIKNIVELRMDNLPRTCTDFKFLQKFPLLKRLEIKASSTIGHGSDFAQIKGLQKLVLVPFNESDVIALGACSNLSSLELMSGKIDGANLEALSNCPLRYLSLPDCDLTCGALKQLGNFSTLKVLNLVWTFCDDNNVQSLGSLHNLKILDVAQCKWLSPGALKVLSKKLPECSIRGLIEVQDPALEWSPSSIGYISTSWNFPYSVNRKFDKGVTGYDLENLSIESQKSAKPNLSAYADVVRFLFSEERYHKAVGVSVNALKLASEDSLLKSSETRIDAQSLRYTSADSQPEHVARRSEIIIRLILARCYYHLNQKEMAEEVLVNLPPLYAYNLSSDSFKLYALYEMTVSVAHHRRDAESKIEEFLSSDSIVMGSENERANARLQIALLFADLKDSENAFSWQRKAKELIKQENEHDSLICDWVNAQLLTDFAQYDKAIAIYEKILKRSDDFRADSAYTLADVCESCASVMEKVGRMNQANSLRATAVEVRANSKYQVIKTDHSMDVNPPILLDISS